VGQVVTLTGSATGTLPISFTWHFGDGAVAFGATVTHSYSLPGSYQVQVTAANSCGQEPVTRTLGVLPLPCEPVTGTIFSWTPLTPTAGQVITLTGDASGTMPISYTWAFGDGTPPLAGLALSKVAGRTGEVITHTYGLPGAYTVTVTATNGCGEATAAHSVTVVAAEWKAYLPMVIKNGP
jgi:PKD repeat protein